LISGICLFVFTAGVSAQQIPSPEEFYGFKMGSDGKLAHWSKIVEYFDLLAARSDRIIVENMGDSTEGNPFLLAIFSAPGNLENLEKYRQISKKLADPRGLGESEIEELIRTGKYVCAQSYSIHASEVGGTQGASELAHELVTSNDPTIRMILENTIFLMFPSFNPDGQIMITEWFNKYKGTPYNNTRLPYLYHLYTGHDNNRDAYQLTQVESKYFAKVVWRDWMPQSYVDHHHMGSSGARFYIPPYLDPIHPNVDPLVWREHQLYGAHMAIALEQAGKSGFETGAPYTAWWQAAFCMAGNYHNITSMLTESASADWADPIYILPDQLLGTRGRPEYKPQMSMPRLWPGGWWHFREIVEQQIISAKAVLEVGARYRESLLRNMVLRAQGNIERGRSEPPYAYIIPKNQHDYLTAVKLAKLFQMNGVEVHRLDKPYRVDSRVFMPGSFVISCAQPKRVFVKSFLEQINYPDNTWTRSHGDQAPIRPYDLAGYSLSEHMGVDAIPILKPLDRVEMTVLTEDAAAPRGTVMSTGPYLLDHSSNESIRAMNRLGAKGHELSWLRESVSHDGVRYAPGAILIRGGASLPADVEALASDLGLIFTAAPDQLRGGMYRLKNPRLGMYKRYAGGNMDEGWTHWLLKDFEFPLTSLFNKDVKAPGLADKYDVIIIPDDNPGSIIEGADGEDIPEEYRGGIGQDGVENIKTFVENGGTLVTLNGSYQFARQVFDLPVRDTLENVSTKDFYNPGSTVKITVETSHPLGYGMPDNALALFRRSPALSISSGEFADGVKIAARYHEQNLLQSGWMIGESYLSMKPAIIEFQVEKGKVLLLAFPVQHRAQMHGTFKFLFNAIYYGPSELVNGSR
jgi:hypothetical protein